MMSTPKTKTPDSETASRNKANSRADNADRISRQQHDAVKLTRLALFDEAFWSERRRQAGALFRFAKRLMDFLISFVALILLSPVLVAIAAAIALESRGPIFFRQLRIGKFNIPFTMYKFRSMRVDAENIRDTLLAINEMDGPAFKIKSDPRVTRVGRFIRRWSLDELPQLFNVLRGDMAIVGPRPLPVIEVADMTEDQMRRHSIKPGLTCIWQISGRNEIPFDEWMQLDLIYVDNQSAMLDIEIFLRTFGAVIGRKGSS
jgi:lipopolysaccharide/colanic/teichoic acid biosynthesis glycosyltransferase